MDMSDIILTTLQVFFIWLSVSLLAASIILTLRETRMDKVDFTQFDTYLTEQAKHEKFFNEIEDYRNDFS